MSNYMLNVARAEAVLGLGPMVVASHRNGTRRSAPGSALAHHRLQMLDAIEAQQRSAALREDRQITPEQRHLVESRREHKMAHEMAQVKARVEHLDKAAGKAAFALGRDSSVPDSGVYRQGQQNISLEDAEIFVPSFVASRSHSSLPVLGAPPPSTPISSPARSSTNVLKSVPFTSASIKFHERFRSERVLAGRRAAGLSKSPTTPKNLPTTAQPPTATTLARSAPGSSSRASTSGSTRERQETPPLAGTGKKKFVPRIFTFEGQSSFNARSVEASPLLSWNLARPVIE